MLLDAWQEYFWLLEHRVSRTAVLSADVDGTADPDAWRAATRALASRHGLLRTAVEAGPDTRPRLVTSTSEVPCVVEVDDGGTVVPAALAQTFGGGRPPLAVHVRAGSATTTVVLAADHAVLDGRSLVVLLADLLDVAGGVVPGATTAVGASQEARLGLAVPDRYEGGRAPDRDAAARPPLDVAVTEVPADLLGALADRARSEGTTVHGCLVAAFLLARAQAVPAWPGPLRCVSPVDSRDLLGAVGELGLLMTIRGSALDPGASPGFWDLARQTRRDVADGRTRQAARAGLAGVRDRIFSGMGSAALVRAAVEEAPALMVTNYGRLGSGSGPLRLRTATPFVAMGSADTQALSVATVGSRMMIADVSQHLLPGLLEAGVDRLARAVA